MHQLLDLFLVDLHRLSSCLLLDLFDGLAERLQGLLKCNMSDVVDNLCEVVLDVVLCHLEMLHDLLCVSFRHLLYVLDVSLGGNLVGVFLGGDLLDHLLYLFLRVLGLVCLGDDLESLVRVSNLHCFSNSLVSGSFGSSDDGLMTSVLARMGDPHGLLNSLVGMFLGHSDYSVSSSPVKSDGSVVSSDVTDSLSVVLTDSVDSHFLGVLHVSEKVLDVVSSVGVSEGLSDGVISRSSGHSDDRLTSVLVGSTMSSESSYVGFLNQSLGVSVGFSKFVGLALGSLESTVGHLSHLHSFFD